MLDVIIVGGGFAGLSAALILGRCRRKVVVYDSGKPRNAVARAIHGFISRDGINPLELREISRKELLNYPSIRFEEREVVDAEEVEDGYEVSLENGSIQRAKYLVLATGVVDRLPEITGIHEVYGHNVFHCPYCDGWEVRDQPVAVLGSGSAGYQDALELKGWTTEVILCTNGMEGPSAEQLKHLERQRIRVRTEKILRLEGEDVASFGIRFHNGELLHRRALFFNPSQCQASPLAEKLGCAITTEGVVISGKLQQTKPRLFVVGDASRSVQFAIVAAAQGAEAAYAVNTALLKEETQ